MPASEVNRTRRGSWSGCETSIKFFRIARRRAPFKDMSTLWPALFTFVEVRGVEGTSNKVERALETGRNLAQDAFRDRQRGR